MARNQNTKVSQRSDDSELIAMTCRLPKRIWRAVKIRAVDKQISAQQVITDAIAEHLKKDIAQSAA
jgi:hypothetical protein